MAIKLTPDRPDDQYVRMYYSLKKDDDGWFSIEARDEEEADDSHGWIEFWSGEAAACKEPLRKMAGRLYVLGERREKRKRELSDEKALAELEEFNRLTHEGLAHRTKAWRLINSEGEAIDAPVTFENAKEVYSDDSHNMAEVVQEYLNGRTNFPLRASNSS